MEAHGDDAELRWCSVRSQASRVQSKLVYLPCDMLRSFLRRCKPLEPRWFPIGEGEHGYIQLNARIPSIAKTRSGKLLRMTSLNRCYMSCSTKRKAATRMCLELNLIYVITTNNLSCVWRFPTVREVSPPRFCQSGVVAFQQQAMTGPGSACRS